MYNFLDTPPSGIVLEVSFQHDHFWVFGYPKPIWHCLKLASFQLLCLTIVLALTITLKLLQLRRSNFNKLHSQLSPNKCLQYHVWKSQTKCCVAHFHRQRNTVLMDMELVQETFSKWMGEFQWTSKDNKMQSETKAQHWENRRNYFWTEIRVAKWKQFQ